MAHDHIVDMFKDALLYRLERAERVTLDDNLYEDARQYFCLRRRRVEKGINELVEERKVKLVASKRNRSALDIVLHSEVTK